MMREVFQAVVVGCLLLFLAPSVEADTQDFAMNAPMGRWFTQTNDVPGPSLAGFPVDDGGGIKFWSEFERLGGVPVLGYPVSERFLLGGFVSQAFQKAILQWRPESGHVAFLNIFDLLHDAGKDAQLQATRQIPSPLATTSDQGKDWAQIVSSHQALLAGNAAIRAAYFADPDPLDHYGLPMTGPVDEGDVIVVRAQRAVFQQWKQATPWAAAGQVTIANGGDIAKEAGLIPVYAVASIYPSFAYVSGGPYRKDAPAVAVHIEDLPPGYVPAGERPAQPAASATCNCPSVPTRGTAPAPSLQVALSPPDPTEVSVENHGVVNRVLFAYEPATGADTATGAIYVEGQTDVFQSVDGATWDYQRLLGKFEPTNRPATVPASGDAATGLVGQSTRASDNAPAALYTVLFRQGNIVEGVTVVYVGAPGSFDLVLQLAHASLSRITAA